MNRISMVYLTPIESCSQFISYKTILSLTSNNFGCSKNFSTDILLEWYSSISSESLFEDETKTKFL